jgi:exonuclease 3'-5' domain-containing protein 2
MEPRILSIVVASLATVASIAWMWGRRREDTHESGRKDGSTRSSEQSIDRGAEDHSVRRQYDLPPHLQRQIYKERRRKEKIPFLAMKSPMYDNIVMLDPEGKALSTISNKKAQWYVSKGLAEWTTPSNVQLRFEPSGRSSGDAYTSSPKSNCCVACGVSGHMMRHYIVPYAYRSLLPNRYKSHQSHDVVILCPKCHLYCEQCYHERRSELEESLRTDPATADRLHVDPHKQHVRSAALALLRWRAKLPGSRIEEYEKIVRQHLGVPCDCALLEELLQQAIDVDYTTRNPNYISGSELVANHLMQGGRDRIADFVKEWRAFFLSTVQPRHLPIGWRVDAKVTCSEHKVRRN